MRSCFLVAAVLACSSKDSSKSDDPVTQDRPREPTLAVTIGGKSVEIAHAYAKTLPYGASSIYLTTGSASCRQLLDNLFTRAAGEQYVLFTAGERLAVDGTLTHPVTSISRMGADVTIANNSRTAVIPVGAGVSIDVEAEAMVDKEGKLAMHGRTRAENCGAEPWPADTVPKAKHASTATVTIAKTKVPIAGARRLDGRRIELSTSPLVCGGSTAVANAILEASGGFWKLRGQWFGTATHQNSSMAGSSGQPETKDLVVKVGAPGTSTDGAVIALELSGSGTIDGYPVALAGTIEALDCP